LTEAQILILTAASVAFVHTILGPDHYLVFTAMGKARDWSLARTLRLTTWCGLGHVLSSVLIGIIGLFLGARLSSVIAIESTRGNMAAWALLAFGLMYFAWGLRKAGRSHRHSHVHRHGGLVHDHEHDHHDEHTHIHDERSPRGVTPWALFIIFILGPCEALIPLFMYPAAQQSASLVVSVAVVFGVVTLATMLACVAITTLGVSRLHLPRAGRYAHAVAGASIVACAGAISVLGL
jgi:sulfite exporter TauE/SafE